MFCPIHSQTLWYLSNSRESRKYFIMGAKVIYVINTDCSSPAMAEREIIRRVEANTGRHAGSWEASVSIHATNDKTRPQIEIVSFSDLPTRLFLLFNNTAIETEPGMIPLLQKVSTFSSRLTRSVRGTEYDFEDFCIRVGLCFDRHNAAKGVVVEIEYRPCQSIAECEMLIAELMDKIAAPLVPPPQANQDPSVNTAAFTNYNCNKVTLDTESLNPKDLNPFSNRTSAFMYAKLLRTT